jgi:hypothetical protein
MRTVSALTLTASLVFGTAHALAADAGADPWSLLTQRDLQAVHDTLAANHPGPVDPQNDRYRQWLNDGLQAASSEAAKARTYGDYTRALRLYLNGFRDGHIAAGFVLAPQRLSWPGFLVGRDANGRVSVLAADKDSNVPLGAELIACDGIATDQLMKQRLDPYYWNADIPHERWISLPRLLQSDPYDADKRMASCTVGVGGVTKTVDLRWRSASRETIAQHVQSMQPPAPELGLRKRQGIWFVTLPSFNYFGEATAGINALIADVTSRAAELRSATVVFDVRGNGGGNSTWGERVASAFWGERAVAHVSGGFDWTVDWRVSPDNIAHLQSVVERNERDGLTEASQSWAKARDAVVQAMKDGRSLVRVDEPPTTATASAPSSMVTGRVFLLTDGTCASACLDFTDVLRRLPNVTHIGLPTSADAVYIDNTQKLLPSGLAYLSYSLKVYRNRVRANNEWYEPKVLWPGGAMTDDAVTTWIAQLASKR